MWEIDHLALLLLCSTIFRARKKKEKWEEDGRRPCETLRQRSSTKWRRQQEQLPTWKHSKKIKFHSFPPFLSYVLAKEAEKKREANYSGKNDVWGKSPVTWEKRSRDKFCSETRPLFSSPPLCLTTTAHRHTLGKE